MSSIVGMMVQQQEGGGEEAAMEEGRGGTEDLPAAGASNPVRGTPGRVRSRDLGHARDMGEAGMQGRG